MSETSGFEINLFLVLAHTLVYEAGAGERALGLPPGTFRADIGGYSTPNYADEADSVLEADEQAYTGTGAFAGTGSLPDIIQSAQPQMDQISLQGTNDYLNGVNGTPGMLALMQSSINPAMQAMTTSNIAANVNNVNQYAPQVAATLAAYNPQSAGLLNTLNQQASQQLNLNGALDPFTKTMLGQDMDAQQAARGMGTGYADAAATAYYQNQNRVQQRAQAQQLAGNVAGATQAFYGDPFSRVMGLGGNPSATMGAYGMGASGSGGAAGPLMSTFSMQNPAIQNIYNAKQSQLNNDAGTWNSVVSGMISGAESAAAGAAGGSFGGGGGGGYQPTEMGGANDYDPAAGGYGSY